MCDLLVALGPVTVGGTALFAKASDRPPGEAQRLEWHPARRDRGPLRTTYVSVAPAEGDTIGWLGSRPAWCWGAEHGVNEAGVAAGNATIYTTLDPRGAKPALIGMDLVRLALERAESAKDAVGVVVRMIEKYGQGGSGHAGVDRPYWSSFLIADADAAFVVETSGEIWACESVSEARAISNRTTIPAFDAAHRHPRQPVERLVDPRLAASQAVLDRPPVTVTVLEEHLRSHEGCDGYGICMHVPGVEVTNAAMVAELPGSSAPSPGGQRRPLVHVSAGSTCSSLFVPLIVGRALGTPVAWERFAQLRPHHRPALAALEAELAADAAEAAADDDAWAPEAWRRIGAALDELGV
ncbi:MAG TPA: hypothetical protein VKV34_11575 [Thermoleophilia bacterium]|nr:hypothetical protein [Thermoleophilia bacterium]